MILKIMKKRKNNLEKRYREVEKVFFFYVIK